MKTIPCYKVLVEREMNTYIHTLFQFEIQNNRRSCIPISLKHENRWSSFK